MKKYEPFSLHYHYIIGIVLTLVKPRPGKMIKSSPPEDSASSLPSSAKSSQDRAFQEVIRNILGELHTPEGC